MALSKELNRLATYTSWPHESRISPLTLAKNGFSYVGNGDEVECFQCKTRLKGSTDNDNPLIKHRQMAPHCQLLNGDCGYNVPLDITTSATKGRTVTDGAGFVNSVDNILQTDEKLTELQLIYRQALSRAKKFGLFLTKNGSTVNRTQPDFGVLQSEDERLRTFYDWPRLANADPAELARDGFFYTGSGYRVQCFHCKGYISNWEPTDVPHIKHQTLNPSCPFAREHVSEDSIRVDRSSNTGVQLQAMMIVPPNTTCLSLQAERAAPPDQLALVTGDPPKFPRLAEYSARLETFRNGGVVGRGQTAEGLADAGWFYVGPNDKVRCFHCGGNLRDWEQDDDPWEEHKRWYDYCQYTKTHRPQPRIRVPETPLPVMPTSAVNYRIEPREVKARMDTPTVRAILDMGYSRDKVRTVIETRLSTTGDDFTNAENLLEALFQLEESMATMSIGATAAGGCTSDDINNSVYSNNSNSSSSRSLSGTSGYSTASSSSSGPLHQPESASLPPNNLTKDSSAPIRSNDCKPLHSEAASMPPILEVMQSKTKAAKKKKNKKKKQSSAATASAATGEDETVEEANEGAQNDQEKNQGDGEPSLEEIPDEEAFKYLEENRQLREARTCKVCMDAEVNTVFLPCGHLVCCATCSPHLKNCPICRTFIRGTVKTFLS